MKATSLLPKIAIAVAASCLVPVNSANSATTWSSGHLRVAGDLDRDGRPDLLAIDVTRDPLPSVPVGLIGIGGRRRIATTVSGVRGLNGSTLWSLTFPGFAFPAPARVGRPAADGALIVTSTDTGQNPAVATNVFAVGGDGSLLWVRSTPGAVPAAVMDLNGDGADDLVAASSLAPSRWLMQMISGVDGSILYQFPMNAEEEPLVGPVVDITKDGRIDFLVIAPTERPCGSLDAPRGCWQRSRVSARRGTDGTEVWATVTYLNCFAYCHVSQAVHAIDDVTGDRKPDLALWALMRVPRSSKAHERYKDGELILDAKTGAPILRAIDAVAAYGVDDVDGDGIGDVGVQMLTCTPTHYVRPDVDVDQRNPKVTCSPHSTKPTSVTLGVVYRAMNRKGKVLHSSSPSLFRAVCRKGGPGCRIQAGLGEVGDVDGDGALDPAHYFLVQDDSSYNSFDRGVYAGHRGLSVAVTSGYSGKPIWRLNARHYSSLQLARPSNRTPFLLSPIGPARSPAYLFSMGFDLRNLHVIGQRPADGATLWRGTFPFDKFQFMMRFAPTDAPFGRHFYQAVPLLPGADLTGDGVPEVVINTGLVRIPFTPPDLRSLVLNGVTGRALY